MMSAGMNFALAWLADTLHAANLKVAEVPGWQARGHANMGQVRGLIMHHTAGAKIGNMPSLGIVTHGRPDLAGPLCNLGLGRDGTWYCVAAGLAYHAGAGNWRGITNGNSGMIGVECENTGLGEPWPDVQLDSFRHGVAAIFRKLGLSADMCCGHKEYALPHGRKIDPTGVDMVRMRQDIAMILAGIAPSPAIIPAHDGAWHATIRRGATGGDDVKLVQKAAGVPETGVFDAATEAAVRRLQSGHGLVADGIVGPRTWAAILTPPLIS